MTDDLGALLRLLHPDAERDTRPDPATELEQLRAGIIRLAALSAAAIPQYLAVGNVVAVECAEVHRIHVDALRKLAGGA